MKEFRLYCYWQHWYVPLFAGGQKDAAAKKPMVTFLMPTKRTADLDVL